MLRLLLCSFRAFAMLKSAKSCAFSAKAVQVSCIFVCKCCENYVRLLRMLFRLRRFGLVISVEIHRVAAVTVFVSGVCEVEIGKILCIFGERVVQCGGFDLRFRLKFIVLRRLWCSFLCLQR